MPSFQFNQFTGRLTESKSFQPLYPISARQLQSAEPPAMIYDTIKTKPVTTVGSRAASSGAPGSGSTLPPKMLKTMAEFQKDLDAPVYLLRGTRDKVMFGLTLCVMSVGIGLAIEFVGRRAFFPPKN